MRRIFNKFKRFIKLNIKAIVNLIKHDGVEHAGYMSFITLLSFFPFLIFVMSVTGFIGQSDQGKELIHIILNNMPYYLTQTLNPRIEEIVSGPPSSLLTISILGVIWTSSSTVEGIRTILNKIYHVSTPPSYILRRLLSIAQSLIITAIIMISMFILILLPNIYQELAHLKYLKVIIEHTEQLNNSLLTPIWGNVRHFVFAITLFTGVIFLYYTIPNVKLKLKSLIPGSILVTILWMLSGSLLLDYIYQFSQVNLVYGSLAGFIITMLFFYIANIIFIYGAEVNQLLSAKEDKLDINGIPPAQQQSLKG